MQDDGNLVIYSQGRAMWESDTHAPFNTSILVLQNDGNLVVYTFGTAQYATSW